MNILLRNKYFRHECFVHTWYDAYIRDRPFLCSKKDKDIMYLCLQSVILSKNLHAVKLLVNQGTTYKNFHDEGCTNILQTFIIDSDNVGNNKVIEMFRYILKKFYNKPVMHKDYRYDIVAEEITYILESCASVHECYNLHSIELDEDFCLTITKIIVEHCIEYEIDCDMEEVFATCAANRRDKITNYFIGFYKKLRKLLL